MKRKLPTAEAFAKFGKVVKESTRAVPKISLPKIKVREGRGDEEEVVLLVSDLQIGHRTPTTNIKKIAMRGEEMARAALKIVELHRNAYPIRKLNLFLMGDLIHHERIGKTVGLDELEAVVYDQMFNGAIPILEKLILTLLPFFPKGIDVWCVPGNHGRFDKFHADSTNLDTIIYKHLEAKFSRMKNLRWHIEAKRFYQRVNIQGHTFLETHGDSIKMWMNIPWYGITQRAMRWQGSLPGGKFDYMTMGHFHVASNFRWNDVEVFVNGSFVTDDEWVLKNIGMNSAAEQWIFGVHPKQGVTFRYKIRL